MVRKKLPLNPVKRVTVASPGASLEDSGVSAGDIEVAIQVVCTAEMFSGQCFRGNKVGHRFNDKECEMYDPECLNSAWGPAKTSKGWQAPGMKGQTKTVRIKAAQ